MADGHTHSWQESDHWWGMIGWGCGDGLGLKVCVWARVRASVCICVCMRACMRVGVGLNEPVWGLNTGGLTTAE